MECIFIKVENTLFKSTLQLDLYDNLASKLK